MTGLTREDFTVLDEARPQRDRDLRAGRQPRPTQPRADASAPAARARVATNIEPPAERGRLFVIVFDDVHMSPLDAQRAKAAVAAFLDRGTQAGDRRPAGRHRRRGLVERARCRQGRADLLEVLKRLDGRRFLDNARERLTDYEAVQIAVYRDVAMAARVQSRFERYGGASLQEMQRSQQKPTGRRASSTPTSSSAPPRPTSQLRSRMTVTLGVLERCFEGLEDSRERKTVLLVSEGFVVRPHPARASAPSRPPAAPTPRSTSSTRAASTRLTSLYSAEFGAPFAEEDLMAAIADVEPRGRRRRRRWPPTRAASPCGDTNDFAAGVVRIGRESRSYYLLGYDPGDIPRGRALPQDRGARCAARA